MRDTFNDILSAVCKETKLPWYEVYDGKYWTVVKKRIVKKFGPNVLNSKEFISWVRDKTEDL